MLGVRDLLAVVLGAALGVALVVAPRTAIRLSVFVGPHRRRRDGEYGAEASIPDWWAHLARLAGVACLAVAGFIAYQAYA
jgi:hypothetical protein